MVVSIRTVRDGDVRTFQQEMDSNMHTFCVQVHILYMAMPHLRLLSCVSTAVTDCVVKPMFAVDITNTQTLCLALPHILIVLCFHLSATFVIIIFVMAIVVSSTGKFTCLCCVVGHILSAGEAEVVSAAAAAHAMLHSTPRVMSPGHPKPTPLPPGQAGAHAAACSRTYSESLPSLNYDVQASHFHGQVMLCSQPQISFHGVILALNLYRDLTELLCHLCSLHQSCIGWLAMNTSS